MYSYIDFQSIVKYCRKNILTINYLLLNFVDEEHPTRLDSR